MEFRDYNEGDLVYYVGEYENCHNFKYRVTKVYKNTVGNKEWFNLEAVNPNIMTHYPEIWSVKYYDLKTD